LSLGRQAIIQHWTGFWPDVTRDLLRSSGYDNPAYHAQMDALLTGAAPAAETDPSDALISFLAKRNDVALAGGSPSEPDKTRGSATVFGDFETSDLPTLQSKFGNLSFDIAQADLDLETALSDPSPRATGRLFVLGQSGDAAALDGFINRARRSGLNEDIVLTKLAPMIQALPAQVQRAQAVTDTQIALALGARLSGAAAQVLGNQSLPALTLPQNQLLLLEAATADGHR